jgi:recombinational DNA repair protein (RecF pathway)
MHTLHTTNAFIVSSAPHGESSRVYRLLTETHGMLYAYAQSVRELRNRNRYALSTGCFVSVTLVRGREMWRLVSARTVPEITLPPRAQYQKMLRLIGLLTPVEDPFTHSFQLFLAHTRALTQASPEELQAVELIGVIRVLVDRGYFASPQGALVNAERICADYTEYSGELCQAVLTHRLSLTTSVNTALRMTRV